MLRILQRSPGRHADVMYRCWHAAIAFFLIIITVEKQDVKLFGLITLLAQEENVGIYSGVAPTISA